MNFLEDSFGRKLFLSAIFLLFTPLVILTSLISLFLLSPKFESDNSITANHLPHFQTYSAQDNIPGVLGVYVEEADARTEIIKKYLRKYNSPLYPYSEYLVKTSDKYLLDYRLIAAIAQQESNLCKIIPSDSHNCWGWGIHSQGTLRFNSYEDAINTVAKGIREKYVDKGYNTVDEIMKKYTPHSDGSWANGVKQFMLDIENPS